MSTIEKLSPAEREALLNNPDNIVFDYVDGPAPNQDIDAYTAIFDFRDKIKNVQKPNWSFKQKTNFVLRNNPELREFKLNCPTLWKLYCIEIVSDESFNILKHMQKNKHVENADAKIQGYMIEKFKKN